MLNSTTESLLKRLRKNKPSTTTTASALSASSPIITTTEKPVKKKTVTFKNVLETSDDVNIVKQVYNPDKVPAVPIIKINKSHEELSRSERFARGDIVMPSRLTEVLKNYSANHIDKLNLLTFKSVNPNNIDKPIYSSPSSDKISFPSFKANATTTSTSDVGCKSISNNVSDEQDNVIGEKKFVMPKRSAHSRRVIKPNKKFLDDDGTNTSVMKHKKGMSKRRKHEDTESKVKKTENFINTTLSSQINSSKIYEQNEEDGCEETTSQTTMSDGHVTGILYLFV